MTTRDCSEWILVSVEMALSMAVLLNHVVTAAYHEASIEKAGNFLADGNIIYGGKCALCHGKDGAGLPNWKSKGQPDFTKQEWQKSHTNQEIADAIKNGKGK